MSKEVLDALSECLAVMGMQLKRESGEWDIAPSLALELWTSAAAVAKKVLSKYEYPNPENKYARYNSDSGNESLPPAIDAEYLPPPQEFTIDRQALERAIRTPPQPGWTTTSVDSAATRSSYMTYDTSRSIDAYARLRLGFANTRANTRAFPSLDTTSEETE